MGSKKTGKEKAAKDKNQDGPSGSHAAAETELRKSKARHVIDRVIAGRAPITIAQRAAFRTLMSDVQAADLGKKTRAADVLEEGVRWMVRMDPALRTYPGALDGYSPERFTWYLDCLAALDDAIEQEGARRKRVGVARATASSNRETAIAARDVLASRMQTFAGRRVPEREALAAAIGTADTPDNLTASLVALVRLSRKWLAEKDETSIFLVKAAHLTADVIDAAAQAADALAVKSADASLEGQARAKDSPDMNRAEGRMLSEMFEAGRLFGEANARSPLVPKLSPGRAIRHVFGLKSARGGTEVMEGAPEEAGGAPEGTGGEAKDVGGEAKVKGGKAKPG